MKNFKIKNPCSENWESIQEGYEGKFCELCQKKVYDLDKISHTEFQHISKKEGLICGMKNSLKPAISGVFLAFTLSSATFTNAQTFQENSKENISQNEITINGKLTSSSERKMISGEISLVTLDKIYSVKSDENGNFSLKFPEKVLKEYNIIRIDYTVLDYNNKEFTDYKSSIFKTDELLGKQNFDIEEKYVLIGEVLMNSPEPLDFYYLNGKKISKRKFEKLRNENPQYKYLAFYDEVTVQKLTKKSFVDNLYLLYSN